MGNQKKISEKEVMETLNEFFYLIDNDIDKIRNYLTEDFMIFEVSRKWNADEFIEFVKDLENLNPKEILKISK